MQRAIQRMPEYFPLCLECQPVSRPVRDPTFQHERSPAIHHGAITGCPPGTLFAAPIASLSKKKEADLRHQRQGSEFHSLAIKLPKQELKNPFPKSKSCIGKIPFFRYVV
ncbi:MAG: hypothetical protein WGN25_18560 [Candidatus Electrothrix sp. GW3-4]|uniref:hypothetical protein n=1 Tax=Candidatus Electrothrix sp. GW3-4 TaxID=3126740 RepID=UPI0030D5E1E6